MRQLRSIAMAIEFTPGTDIGEACCDICELANRVDCLVKGKFNDVTVMAVRGDNPSELAESWHTATKSKNTYKFARCR